MAQARCHHCEVKTVSRFAGVHCPRCLLRAALNMGAREHPLRPVSALSTTKRLHPVLGSFCTYRLLKKIALGGMGVVYKARQVSLQRIVAVKMLLDGSLATEADLHRFRTEAELVAGLQHPNIIAIHELGEQDGRCYFCMDYIEGATLAQLAQTQPLSIERAARYVKTIAEAMQYAHRHGVLHRDLKPSNILIDGFDQPRITDFGLAKRFIAAAHPEDRRATRLHAPTLRRVCPPARSADAACRRADLTLAGQIVGSPAYMSAEQAAGDADAVAPASDIYSMGAILYYLLTSRPPFSADTVPATLRLVREKAPVPPRRLNAGIPARLESICLTCLEKQPRHRFASAGDLALELNSILVHARPVAAPRQNAANLQG